MKVVTNQEARQGKSTVYRGILAACLVTIRAIGQIPDQPLRYYCACYQTADMAIGNVVYDKVVGKWIYAECRFWTGNGDETETRIINLF